MFYKFMYLSSRFQCQITYYIIHTKWPFNKEGGYLKGREGQVWVVWSMYSQSMDSYPLRSLGRHYLWMAWTYHWDEHTDWTPLMNMLTGTIWGHLLHALCQAPCMPQVLCKVYGISGSILLGRKVNLRAGGTCPGLRLATRPIWC